MATQVLTNNSHHHHHHHVTFSGSSGGLRQAASPGPTTSISANGLPLLGYIVEHDNPFRPGSELIEEAENILKNVTIVGSQVTISGLGNDSGIVTQSPPHNERSPANGDTIHAVVSPQTHEAPSAVNETQLHCSTILSSTSSTPGGPLRVTEDCVVVRASPESCRPESPALRAEHVVVTSSGGVKSSPSSTLAVAGAAPSSSSATQQPGNEAASPSTKDKKKKGKKKCSIL